MNNRNYTRVSYLVGASLSFGSDVLICNTHNVSLRGMYLKTGYEIPLGIPVNVTVYHSNQSSLKFDAKVVRIEESGVGLLIDCLNANSFAKLCDIVAENSSNRSVVMQETYGMLQYIY